MPDDLLVAENSINKTQTTSSGITVSGEWKVYQNKKRGFEVKYPALAEIKENSTDVLGRIKITFDNCYLGLDGLPFGIENPDIKADSWQDEVKVAGKYYERNFIKFLNKEHLSFASILIDYAQDKSYPYFLIYHSADKECLPTINQMLSIFKFID